MPRPRNAGDYTVREAAAALPACEQTIYRKLKLGEIPHYRDERGRIFIKRDYVRLQRATGGGVDATLAYIERVLADAPPLSDEQRNRLAEILAPARGVA